MVQLFGLDFKFFRDWAVKVEVPRRLGVVRATFYAGRRILIFRLHTARSLLGFLGFLRW